MEGTSGSAGLALLRGRVGKAALGLGLVRASDASGIGDPRPSRGGIVRWDRLACAGVSTQRGDGLTTRGVRADRAGVVCSRALARMPVIRRTWPGTVRYRLPPFGPWPVKPRRAAASTMARGLGLTPALDSAARTRCRDGVVGRGFGRACRRRPSAAKVRRGSGSSVREPMPETEAGGARERSPALALVRGAGIRRSAVVLADRTGCRSRRGALDPGRKVEERAISAMEGVLARHGLLSLTRRRPDRASGPEAMGMRQRCQIRRGDR